jgi:hypothetical protein
VGCCWRGYPAPAGTPQVRAAAAAHVGERDQQRAETQTLLQRHRAGEAGIALSLTDLLALLGDGDAPRGVAG